VNNDVSDKETINSLRCSEKDIDCCVIQNSVAIVQPLKKVIIETGASAKRFDEKNQKLIDASKNSASMSHKYEPKSRNNSKANATNEIASRMSDCGNNNLNIGNQKVATVGDGEKCNNVTNISETKMTSKENQKKDNSGNSHQRVCAKILNFVRFPATLSEKKKKYKFKSRIIFIP
jgi:hypothetical protein